MRQKNIILYFSLPCIHSILSYPSPPFYPFCPSFSIKSPELFLARSGM